MFKKWLKSIVGALIFASMASAVPIAPNSGSLNENLCLWLRMPEVNYDSATGIWTDLSGKGHDARADVPNYVAPLTSLGENPAVFARPFSTVLFDPAVSDMLRATDLNDGQGLSELTIFVVYSTSTANNQSRPVGFGSYPLGDLADNFNLAGDVSIRKDNGSVAGATTTLSLDTFMIRVARMDPGRINQWLNADGDLTLVQEVSGSSYTTGPDDFYVGDVRNSAVSGTIHIAEIVVFNAALTDAQVEGVSEWLQAYVGRPNQIAASGPKPGHGAIDVPRDVTLSWTPVATAVKRDVYFGMSFEDVNTATVPAAPNLDTTSLDLGRLEFGTEYFWRVDEVNDAPDYTVFPGNVWSFEVEPEGIPFTQLTATASSQNSPEEDPNNTLNGVGLEADGSHSTDRYTMWLSDKSDADPWIRYDLAEPRKLVEMLVWNHNTQSEEDLGYGIREARISVSRDGIDFTDLGIVTLAQAAETAVDLQGAYAQSVKISVVSNYDGSRSGLSEVRLYAIPNAARELSPADGTADVNPATAVLSWRAGREAGAHDVYVSTDEQAVIDGTATKVTVPAASATPNLELGKTYYWRVDEVNNVEDPAVWAGSVQSFSTAGSIPVDNMESYKNQAGLYIFEAWVDGYQINDNGSLVGVGANFEAEKTIVYEGSQSLPMFYGDLGIKDSWATLTLPASNWSKYGIKSLSLYFRGSSTNTAGQLYVKINNTKFEYKGAATDILTDQWFPFTIDLAGVTTVNSLTVGVAGGSGIVYVDDIRLYPLASELIAPVQPGTANLKALYDFAGNLNDGSGNGYNGTAIGAASVVTDPVRGQVVSLNGLDQGVKIPLIGIVPEATIGMWINLSIELATGVHGGLFHDDGFEPNDIHWRVLNGTLNGGINGGLANGAGKTSIVTNTWIHVALTASPDGVSFWVNGIRDLASTQVTPVVNLGAATLGAWLDTRTVPAGVLSRTFPGLLDEVRLYDRVLTPAELAGLAGRTAPVYKPF